MVHAVWEDNGSMGADVQFHPTCALPFPRLRQGGACLSYGQGPDALFHFSMQFSTGHFLCSCIEVAWISEKLRNCLDNFKEIISAHILDFCAVPQTYQTSFCSTFLFARARWELEGGKKNFSMHFPGYLVVAFCTSYGNEEHHAKGMNDLGGEREIERERERV